MGPTLKASLLAPAPVFLPLAALLVLPRLSFGWPDTGCSVGIAFCASYGFVWTAGLAAHLLLTRLNRPTLGHYVCAFLLAGGALVAALTLTESPAPPPVEDHSPYAGLTLRDGGWIALIMLWCPLVAGMAATFWSEAGRTADPAE